MKTSDRYTFEPPEEARSFEEFVRRSNIEYFGIAGRTSRGVRWWRACGAGLGLSLGGMLFIFGIDENSAIGISVGGLLLAITAVLLVYVIRSMIADVKRQREIKRLGRRWAAMAKKGKIPLTEEEADRREQAARARRTSTSTPTASTGTPAQPTDPQGTDDQAPGSPST